MPGAFLVFARESTLFAARFDPEWLELQGSPVPVLEDLAFSQGNGGARFTFSQSGTAVYRTGEDADDWTSTLVRVSRDGLVTPLPLEGAKYSESSLSPDERFVSVSLRDFSAGVSNIWIYDLERDVATRLTFEEAREWWPSWTPNGKYITFSSDREGDMQIYRKPADGSGEAELLTPEIDGAWGGGSWSPDGTTLVFTRFVDTNGIEAVNPGQGGVSETYLHTDANELFPAVSPDGRWVAYQSDESGDAEIYVRPFPGPGGKWQISRGGGRRPLWSRDGGELLFLTGRKVNSVPVTIEDDSLRAGRSRELFTLDRRVQGYDVARDGSFIMILRNTEEAPEVTRTIATFVFNWPAELDERVL